MDAQKKEIKMKHIKDERLLAEAHEFYTKGTTMIILLPELGYTPANLRALREQARLTRRQVADITNTVNYETIARWETDVGKKNHADMPQYKWQMLMETICEDI